jgi:hypothetical protein
METPAMKSFRLHILLFFLMPLVLIGQDDTLSVYQRSLPKLNDHYFMPNSNFLSPFMATFFKTGIGGGVSQGNIPVYTNDGELLVGTIEGEDTYVTADVHVQVEAKEWLAVWFRYQAIARIGSSTPAIFAHGVTSITGFDFGWMLRLWHNKQSQLSGTLNIRNFNISAINISGYIRDVIAGPDSIKAAPYKKDNPLDGGAGLRYAYAFNNMFGAQAFFNGAYGESASIDNKNIWRFDVGILGDVNFKSSHNVPLGINLGYTVQKFSISAGQDEEKTNSLILKLAYTGREEYNIGLEFSHITTTYPLVEDKNKLEYITTAFVMVYYF